MTDYATTTNLSRWDSAFVDYQVAKAAYDAISNQPPTRSQDRINDLVADARLALFSVPAPRLGDIAGKLTAYWGDQLFEVGRYGADWRRRAVGDIRRIEMQLAGVEEPDASGGFDMDKVDRDWADALRQHNDWAQLLAEGHSDRWADRRHGDIVALKDEVERTLLSLSAPNLLAVIKKLEILWADQRFDPVDETVDHHLILRDLRRFALTHQG